MASKEFWTRLVTPTVSPDSFGLIRAGSVEYASGAPAPHRNPLRAFLVFIVLPLTDCRSTRSHTQDLVETTASCHCCQL